MKIVLLRCPWVTVSTYPPDIGFAYIATLLKESGHNVLVVDLNIELYHKIEADERKNLHFCNKIILFKFGMNTLQKYKPLMDDAVNRIMNFQPEIVCFCVWETNGIISLELAKRIKRLKSATIIIFGGPDCYPLFSGKKFIEEKAVDAVIYGEAEITLKRVLYSVRTFGKVFPTPGIIYKENGRIIDCGWPDLVENLDELPFLSLDGFRLELYGAQKTLPIFFNRGCVYKCEYCPREMYPKFRSRSPENIVQEIEYLQNKYSNAGFLVCDSTITANLKQLERLCDLILFKGLEVSFGGFASSHIGMDYRFLSKLKKAGFNSFTYGVESGSEKILSRFGKKISVETIVKVIRDTYAAGIEVGIDLLVGLPGESDEDFKKTIDFLIHNKKYLKNIGINYFGVTPYSYIFSHLDEFELIQAETKIERFKTLKEVVRSLCLRETVEHHEKFLV